MGIGQDAVTIGDLPAGSRRVRGRQLLGRAGLQRGDPGTIGRGEANRHPFGRIARAALPVAGRNPVAFAGEQGPAQRRCRGEDPLQLCRE